MNPTSENELEQLRKRAENLQEQLKALSKSSDQQAKRIGRLRASVAGLGLLMLILIAGFLFMTAATYSDYISLKRSNDVLQERLSKDAHENLLGAILHSKREPLPAGKAYAPKVLHHSDAALPVKDKVLKIMSTVLDQPITPGQRFGRDIKINELEMAQLMLIIEWDCRVTFSNTDLYGMETVQTFIELVEQKTAQPEM